ncbi:MAG: helix-turn-helix domain-containing protein, partial [Firmicutes bacterium]|nr:helix-turn-helix domain-containing protein [Candidatus Gallilactobacillus intestinavium]
MSKIYNLSQAAKILNVSKGTLQRWDRQGLFIAKRTNTNRRFYTEEDINNYFEDSKRRGFNRNIFFVNNKENKEDIMEFINNKK